MGREQPDADPRAAQCALRIVLSRAPARASHRPAAFTDQTSEVEVFTPRGTYQKAWRPKVTSSPRVITRGKSYVIRGTQFNGLSQGAMYNDDFQDATNYPLVRVVNLATKDVFYCRTHDHSTMAVATGSEPVSTHFDVPVHIESGRSSLYVVANGIPSLPVVVTVQ